MKRLFAVLLTVAAVLSMTACGAQQPEQDPSAPDTHQPTQVTQPTQATQEMETSGDDSVNAEALLIGKWVLHATMPVNIKNTQTMEFNQDGTMVYVSVEHSPDGTVKEEDPIVYQWTLEDGQVTCVCRNHTIIYLFDTENMTLTDKNQIDRIFNPEQ